MATLPVNNPRIPFVGRIPGNGLYHGVMIRVQGILNHMPMGHQRFSINLQREANTDLLGDVALHLDFRVSENVVVRNHHTYTDGWVGPEERHGGFPLIPGQNYEILILAMNHCYKIAINGRHFCEFNHRLPLQIVQYLHINGDTTVNSIRLDWDVNQGPVPSAPPSAPSSISVAAAATPSFPSHNQVSAVGVGYVPPPTMYVPSYSAPPPVYGPPDVVHQPILMAPPYGTQYAQPPYGGPPPGPPPPGPPGPYGPYGMNPSAQYGGGPVMMNKEYLPPDIDNSSDKKTKYLKYAAIAGGAGLGAYALTKIFDNSDSD